MEDAQIDVIESAMYLLWLMAFPLGMNKDSQKMQIFAY